MPKPAIGITTLRVPTPWNYNYVASAEAYAAAVSLAGAIPVLMPVGLPEEDLDRLREIVDGIVFTGGKDIEPSRYGEESHPSVTNVDSDQDRTELYLARQSAHHGTPFLAICRGMQIVNVALGGTLYPDIAAQVPNALKHDYFSRQGYPRNLNAHPIQIQPGVHTSRILGQPTQQVNSLHHQGVNRLAPGLIPTAYAPDGILEGFELPGHPYGIAVQWHPEWLTDKAPMRALFEGLVQAANGKTGA